MLLNTFLLGVTCGMLLSIAIGVKFARFFGRLFSRIAAPAQRTYKVAKGDHISQTGKMASPVYADVVSALKNMGTERGKAETLAASAIAQRPGAGFDETFKLAVSLAKIA